MSQLSSPKLASVCLATLALPVLSVPAKACQCGVARPGANRDFEASDSAYRFERAKNVVRENFTQLTLGPDVRKGFSIKMDIKEAIKGDLKGQIELSTGFGNEDCGLDPVVVNAMFYGQAVDVEIRRALLEPGKYGIDSCGYINLPPAGKQTPTELRKPDVSGQK